MRDRILAGLRRTGTALALSAWTFASAQAIVPVGPNQYVPVDVPWFCGTDGTCTLWTNGTVGNPADIAYVEENCNNPALIIGQWFAAGEVSFETCHI